jgi:hypothetical protein
MSIKSKKFMALQKRVDEQVAKIVTTIQSKVEALEAELKQIADAYPTNAVVIEKLGRFSFKQESISIPSKLQVQMKMLTSTENSSSFFGRGRPRIKPRWRAEWNDGTKVEFTPNPFRTALAEYVKSKSASIQFSINENNTHIFIQADEQQCRVRNPFPNNQSGLKSVGVF